MNVLVLTTRVPFIHGGAEELRDNLVLNLRQAGVSAEAMSLPFSWDPAERLIEEMWIARTIEVVNADRVIALKFPAYLVPHSNKVCWVLHQYRQAYDLFDALKSNIPTTPRGDAIRQIIRTADNDALGTARALFTLSPTGQARMRRYNNLEAEVLPQPLNDPELFSGGEPEGYIFAGGRVGKAKRQELLIRALAHAPRVRLVIAGPPDEESEGPELAQLADKVGVSDRVTLDLRFLPRSEIAHLVNGAIACAYIPFDEDSVGYVTMEAFQAGKPVVSASDSGGVLEIVRHNETGLVASPNAEALGEALSVITHNRTLARSMGAAGHQLLADRAMTWQHTIERLLA